VTSQGTVHLVVAIIAGPLKLHPQFRIDILPGKSPIRRLLYKHHGPAESHDIFSIIRHLRRVPSMFVYPKRKLGVVCQLK